MKKHNIFANGKRFCIYAPCKMICICTCMHFHTAEIYSKKWFKKGACRHWQRLPAASYGIDTTFDGRRRS